MKKRFISLVLAAALAASMTAPAFAVSNFSDVPDTHWASSYINEMVGGGLIQGYGHGKFSQRQCNHCSNGENYLFRKGL